MTVKHIGLSLAAGALALTAFQASASGAPAPSFVQYSSPKTMGTDAGEPSVGVVWNPGATLQHDTVNAGGVILFQSGPHTLRINLDDATSPATATWEDVSTDLVRAFVLSDPIGFVDSETGRVFSGDLIGGEGQSFMAFTDDSGETYTPSEGGPPGGSPDHETIGAGPYSTSLPLPFPGPVLYDHAVYYCGQAIATNFCSRSDDGGMTFGPQVPTVAPPDCEPAGAQNGHVKVGPDGTVYLPQGKCPNAELGAVSDMFASVAGLSISTDNGTSWAFSKVPNSTSNNLDPSVATDNANNVYLTWLDADNKPHVATSHDHGATWVNDTKIGDSIGIQNANFVVSTGGDAGRAAVGFIGSTTRGDPNATNSYTGLWHMYVAVTYDAGVTWTVVDGTPDDPVQVGSVCTSGTTCGTDRNLLDFNDMHLDKFGRIIVGFADGCLPPNCTTATGAKHPPYNSSRAARASILRQGCGKSLFAAYDDQFAATACPKSSKALGEGSDPVPMSGGLSTILLAPLAALGLVRRRRALLGAILAAYGVSASAADPASGTVSEATPGVEYTVPAAPVPNGSAPAGGGYACDAADPCDEYQLTLDLPSDYMDTHPNALVHVEAAADVSEFDIDLQVSDGNGTVLYSHRDNPPDQPSLDIFPMGGTEHFVVQVVPGTPHSGAHAKVTLIPGDTAKSGGFFAGALNLLLLAPLALLGLRARRS